MATVRTAVKRALQARQRKPAKPKGLKKPSPELERIIKLANLAGDAFLPESIHSHPTINSLTTTESILPDAVRLHLLEVALSESAWKRSSEQLVGEYKADGMKVSVDLARALLQDEAIHQRYLLIRSSRAVLRAIARGENSFPVFTYFERKIDSKKRHWAEFAGSDIGKALHKVDLRYIKVCEICNTIFFAGRFNQDACDPNTCAKTLRKRRERASALVQQELTKRKARKK